MTRGAREFVAPLTFAVLSEHEVFTEVWGDGQSPDGRPRRARGLGGPAPRRAGDGAHDRPSSPTAWRTTSSRRISWRTAGPCCSLPPWRPRCGSTRRSGENCETLAARGVRFVGPGAGLPRLGPRGRRPDGRAGGDRRGGPRDWPRSRRDLAGLQLLVTAGPTREPIDPVRFVSNRSSGRMGYALAEAARDRGAARDAADRADGPAAAEGRPRCSRFETADELHALLVRGVSGVRRPRHGRGGRRLHSGGEPASGCTAPDGPRQLASRAGARRPREPRAAEARPDRRRLRGRDGRPRSARPPRRWKRRGRTWSSSTTSAARTSVSSRRQRGLILGRDGPARSGLPPPQARGRRRIWDAVPRRLASALRSPVRRRLARRARDALVDSLEDELAFFRDIGVTDLFVERPPRRAAAGALSPGRCPTFPPSSSSSRAARAASSAKTRTNIVFGQGNPKADLMFVGEAPGRDEDEQGLAFVGRAGQLLTKIIEAMGKNARGRLHRERPEVPPSQQPQPRAGRGRLLPAVSRGADPPDLAAGHRDARNLRGPGASRDRRADRPDARPLADGARGARHADVPPGLPPALARAQEGRLGGHEARAGLPGPRNERGGTGSAAARQRRPEAARAGDGRSATSRSC